MSRSLDRAPDTTAAGLLRDHMDLRGQMREVEESLYRLRGEGSKPGDRDVLVARLRDLRDEFVRHFAREEGSGLLGRGDDGGGRVTAKELFGQHELFRRDLALLVAMVEHEARLSADLLDLCAVKVAKLFANIRWHEAIESGVLKRFDVRE